MPWEWAIGKLIISSFTKDPENLLVLTTLRFTFSHLNSSLEFFNKAPSKRLHSVKIWNPLHMPIIGTPFLACLMTSLIAGDLEAIIPARK